MKFGEHIKALRLNKGKTQSEIAAAMGVGKSYLSKIEKGILPAPAEETLKKLAIALDYDIYQLIAESGKLPEDFKKVILEDKQVFDYVQKKAIKHKKEQDQ